MRGLSYVELAFRIIRPFVGDAFDDATLRRLIGAAHHGESDALQR